MRLIAVRRQRGYSNPEFGGWSTRAGRSWSIASRALAFHAPELGGACLLGPADTPDTAPCRAGILAAERP
jgi:hypothetical protein